MAEIGVAGRKSQSGFETPGRRSDDLLLTREINECIKAHEEKEHHAFPVTDGKLFRSMCGAVMRDTNKATAGVHLGERNLQPTYDKMTSMLL